MDWVWRHHLCLLLFIALWNASATDLCSGFFVFSVSIQTLFPASRPRAITPPSTPRLSRHQAITPAGYHATRLQRLSHYRTSSYHAPSRKFQRAGCYTREVFPVSGYDATGSTFLGERHRHRFTQRAHRSLILLALCPTKIQERSRSTIFARQVWRNFAV